ncbi:hypothetical protein F4778DRAFT_784987 [Xylariomycetidae sp. FL2044]|nr:hypothetical protein F4778DRAFT_784987 [Xylariomycetidae sp. FL2044]
MPYQYPPPLHSGAGMGMPQSNYMPSYPTPTTAGMEGTSMPLALRRESLSKRSKLKRSFSTPNVRPQGMNDADQGSPGFPGEKKRNKLGYHRTTIACGKSCTPFTRSTARRLRADTKDGRQVHCRKRKIRCMPQPGDFRCVACIRLKKDCSFKPVEQQPPAVQGQKLVSRSSMGLKLESPAESPAITHGHPPSVPSHQPYHHLATMPSIQSMAPPSTKPDYPEENRIPSNASGARTFGYGQGMTNWVPAETSASSSKMAGEMNNSWRNYPHESPVTPGFSPYTHQPAPTPTPWQASPSGMPMAGEASSRPDDGWSSFPAPTRSTSYGGEPSGHYVASTRTLDRRPSMAADLYQPTISTNMEGVAGTAMDPRGSLSAGAVAPAAYGTWQQQQQQPYHFAKASDNYGGWYAEPGVNATESSGPENPQSGSMYYGGR